MENRLFLFCEIFVENFDISLNNIVTYQNMISDAKTITRSKNVHEITVDKVKNCY